MNIWYLNNNNEFVSTSNSTLINLYDMLQRLQTFKGEQSFNALNGVDYFSVFNRQSFLKPQIETIEKDYSRYFRDIENVFIASQESIRTDIRVTLLDGSTANLNAII